MKDQDSSGFPIVRLALFTAGAYLLWANRFKIQETLEANGISTPWLKGNVGEAVQSGVAKISGKVDREVRAS